MLEWVVVADDRTGALEVAGGLARSVGPVAVVTDLCHSDCSAVGGVVLDAGTRHLEPSVACQRAFTLELPPSRRQGVKIDSLLRGNWAVELVARQRADARRVMVVPAFPALGRTCVDGFVRVAGEPVPADARADAQSMWPADQLRAAGAAEVVLLRSVDEVAAWVATAEPQFAVCDVATDDDLHAVARAWATAADITLAGTAASIAAAALETTADRAAPAPPQVVMPALIVCGSLHPTARAQLAALTSSLANGDVELLVSPEPATLPVSADAAERTASGLATETQRALASKAFRTLIVVGGDTAAAVLGPSPRIVGGTVGIGMPWSRRLDGTGPLVITKGGSFGSVTTLVELLEPPSGVTQ